MSFYKHFDTKPTSTGMKWVHGRARYHVRQILAHCKPAKTVLEIGPGKGVFASEWSLTGGEYTAIEPSPALAANLREAGYTDIIEAFVPPILIADSSYDVVYASHVLEHMSNAHEAIAFMDELARITRTEGLVCIHVPDYLAFGSLFWDADYTHSYITTERRVRQLMENSGLAIVHFAVMSGPTAGFTAWVLSSIFKLLPHRLIMALMPESWKPSRVYNVKTTFSRQLFFIGQKPDIAR